MSPSDKSGAAVIDSLSHLPAQDRYRILLESAFDWEYWQLPDGRFEYVSPSCKRITGYGPEEFISDPDLYMRIIHPEDRGKVNTHHCRLTGGSTTTLEFRIIRKDGRQVWIDHLCRRIEDDRAGFMGCRASNRDITLKKEVELRFRERAQQAAENSLLLKSIIEYTPIGILVAKLPNLDIYMISNRGCELEGHSPQELGHISADKYKFYYPGGQLAPIEQMPLVRAARKGENVVDEEWEVLRPDGIRVTILCTAGPILDEKGRIVGGVMIWQDISRRKHTEHVIAESRRHLIELKEQLERKNKEMESIIGIVSHDLRSPLVSIQGFGREIRLSIETIRKILASGELTAADIQKIDDILKGEVPEFLGFIKTSASAMDQLVKSLVKVARAGMTDLSPEQLDMDELISNVAGSLGFEIKRAGVELDIEPLPDCYADRQQVTQIFSNLVDNAVKYRDPERPLRIHIYGRLNGERSCYAVEDNGIGIPPEYQDRIFNLFDRVPQQRCGGEGIGLALVKRMVERNGGLVHLQSELGKGTRFGICLPAAKKPS